MSVNYHILSIDCTPALGSRLATKHRSLSGPPATRGLCVVRASSP